MKVLVTGGAGFVGSHLVDGLLAAGHVVRVLDALAAQVHGETERPADLSPEAELVKGDVRDHAAVARALEGVEAVFHQAAAVGIGQSMYEIERYVSANSVGTAVLLEEIAARRDRIRKLVVASSMSLYGEGAYHDARGNAVHPPPRPTAQFEARRWELRDASGAELTPAPTPETKPLQPTSVYAITKRDHEELSLTVGSAYGIPTTALRYFNVYGPRQALSNPYTGVLAIFASRLLNGRAPLIFEDGLQSRDFVHVTDIVQANLLALASPADGAVYNVGTGRATTIADVALELARALGKPIEPEIPGRYRAGDVRHCIADVSKIRAELGYEPRVAFEQGVKELLDWLHGQAPVDRVDEATRELEARGLAR
ncbi:MAG TPA: NAD-dependent epimerase/dehydratase family protein [Myxococcota bacterium]|jgi:dTDP-L-rhamnose 4-epimerase|nr:NAD-dependent epimerase/dehydratase family protein [Myxococcota bacterium]